MSKVNRIIYRVNFTGVPQTDPVNTDLHVVNTHFLVVICQFNTGD